MCGRLRKYLGHWLLLLGGSSNIFSDERFNLFRIVTTLIVVIIRESILLLLVWLEYHCLLLLWHLIHHHIGTLVITGRENVIDGILGVLLAEMLLEELRYGIFDAFQVHQECTIECLFGLGVQIIILM